MRHTVPSLAHPLSGRLRAFSGGRALLLAACMAASGASALAQGPQVATPDGSPPAAAAGSAQRADRGPAFEGRRAGERGPRDAGPRHGPHHHHPGMGADGGQRFAARLESLRQKLQLTPAQQPAWDTFATALRTPPAGMAELRDPARREAERAAMQRMTTPERIDRMRALRAQHIADADRRGDAVKAFYATLTPPQQRVFDAEPPFMAGPRGPGRFGPGDGPRSPEGARRGPPPGPPPAY